MEETKLYSKKGFLELLKNNIKEDDVIVMSAQIEDIKVVPKRNCKTVTFGFAANAFKKEGVKHLMNGETYPAAFCIAKKETLSDEVLEIVKQIENKEK